MRYGSGSALPNAASSADVSGADLIRSVFLEANLKRFTANKARMAGCALSKAKCVGASFLGAAAERHAELLRKLELPRFLQHRLDLSGDRGELIAFIGGPLALAVPASRGEDLQEPKFKPEVPSGLL